MEPTQQVAGPIGNRARANGYYRSQHICDTSSISRVYTERPLATRVSSPGIESQHRLAMGLTSPQGCTQHLNSRIARSLRDYIGCDVLQEGVEFQAASNRLPSLFPARIPTDATANFVFTHFPILFEAFEYSYHSNHVDSTRRHC